MRRVVSDLRPPELEDLGLAAALADLADRVSAAGLRVELGCAGLPELSAAVELAGYRIVQEAVTNAVRHAGASTVRVTVGAHGGELAVCVTDDGRGLPGDAVPGVGSTSMRERAVELGGDLERGPAADGGTVVRARVPLVPR
jgi:signal transduction histidine kinase